MATAKAESQKSVKGKKKATTQVVQKMMSVNKGECKIFSNEWDHKVIVMKVFDCWAAWTSKDTGPPPWELVVFVEPHEAITDWKSAEKIAAERLNEMEAVERHIIT